MDLGTQNDLRVAFTVNATPVTVRSNHPHLLAALREELDITSPKDGCSPTGQCGCCTVWVNGKAVVSCQTPLSKVAGGTVTTLEGVDKEFKVKPEKVRYLKAEWGRAQDGSAQCNMVFDTPRGKKSCKVFTIMHDDFIFGLAVPIPGNNAICND